MLNRLGCFYQSLNGTQIFPVRSSCNSHSLEMCSARRRNNNKQEHSCSLPFIPALLKRNIQSSILQQMNLEKTCTNSKIFSRSKKKNLCTEFSLCMYLWNFQEVSKFVSITCGSRISAQLHFPDHTLCGQSLGWLWHEDGQPKQSSISPAIQKKTL